MALERIRSFLLGADSSDFPTADDFADAVIEEIETAYSGSFESARAKAIVKRQTADIYTWYRLRDTTPFGQGRPPKLDFGGPDTRAVKFFNKLDGFYFSTFVDNRQQTIRDFLREEYLEKGAALFGRESPESLDDFRRAANGKLDNINDQGVQVIIRSSVQRIRNYAHINSLRQGAFKWAKVMAILDARTTPICAHLNGKFIRVGVAAKAIDRFTKMDAGEYALDLYKGKQGRAYAQNPVEYVRSRVGGNGVIADSLVAEGRGFPPYHPNCRTRVQGVETAVGDVEPEEE